jgi:putative redox protein
MSTKTAVVKQLAGLSLMGKADSNHWVAMDGPADFGGSNAGTRPVELVLLALGGCTGSDVISILKKKRAEVDALEIRIEAEQAEEHPKVFTRIHVEYVVTGHGVRPEDVARAIDLSETKYCSVSAMLRSSVEISHSYRVVEAAVPAAGLAYQM